MRSEEVLANVEPVIALLNKGTARRPARDREESPAAKRRNRRCQCGQCRRCLEVARWERIFAEKFEDPTYYTRLTVRTASPLISV